MATFRLWINSVNPETVNVINKANTKTRIGISVWYAKSFSHILAVQKANGHAIRLAIIISTKNDLESVKINCLNGAPNILRMLISLIRCVLIRAISPYNPRIEIRMVNKAKTFTILEN